MKVIRYCQSHNLSPAIAIIEDNEHVVCSVSLELIRDMSVLYQTDMIDTIINYIIDTDPELQEKETVLRELLVANFELSNDELTTDGENN